MKLPTNVEKILKTIRQAGHSAYAVGGCVRDSLLGVTPNDWDLCTSATPTEIMDIFKGFKIVPSGIEFGTVTILIESSPYEITTYRVDGNYGDNRRPDGVNFTKSLAEDLSRRDFTINAMAFNDGLIDPFGGKADLEAGIVRCVGDPNKRFAEDALRMLRAIRFAARFNFIIDSDTKEAINENSKLILNVSAERIQEELNKILLTQNPSVGLRLMSEMGLLGLLLPELDACVGFDQRNKHHDKDVFEHTLSVVDNIPCELKLRLAALFHDVGKPLTFSLDADGQGRFFGHESVSAEIAESALSRLKYPRKTIEHVVGLVKNHMIRYPKDQLREPVVRRFIRKVGADSVEDLIKLFIADKEGRPVEDIFLLKEMCTKILSDGQPLGIKDLAINGHDLLGLGFQQGKEIGETLSRLLEKVLDRPELNNKEKLLRLAVILANKNKGKEGKP